MSVLWTPSAERIAAEPLSAFQGFCAERGLIAADADHATLHQWSVADSAAFWSAVWDFCEVRAAHRGDEVLTQAAEMLRPIVQGRKIA